MNYHGYNSQDEYDYYNRKSRQDSANIAAVCFTLLALMVIAAAILNIAEKVNIW